MLNTREGIRLAVMHISPRVLTTVVLRSPIYSVSVKNGNRAGPSYQVRNCSPHSNLVTFDVFISHLLKIVFICFMNL